MTPTKSQSERKKGACQRGNHPASLLLINSCAMKGVNHRKKAAVVKKNQKENSQVCVLCCATDKDRCCRMSREQPIQQVPSTLQTGDLGKAFLHHQEPGRISNLACTVFFQIRDLFPHNSSTESTRWEPSGETPLHGQSDAGQSLL